MKMEIRGKSSFVSWLIVILCAAGILLTGLFAYKVVGDLGQPGWAYRPARDIPGESPDAIYKKLPNPQHVRGTEGE